MTIGLSMTVRYCGHHCTQLRLGVFSPVGRDGRPPTLIRDGSENGELSISLILQTTYPIVHIPNSGSSRSNSIIYTHTPLIGEIFPMGNTICLIDLNNITIIVQRRNFSYKKKKFSRNGKLGHSCARVMKSRLYESRVRDHVMVRLGLNVGSSAHNCGCVVDGGNAMQQLEYYY